MVLSCLADFISSISDQRGLQYTVYICLYIVVNTGGSTVGEKLGVKVNIGTTILGIMYTVVLAFAESIERNRTIEIGGKLNKKYLIL